MSKEIQKYQKQIEELQSKIDELNKRKSELLKLKPEQRMAILLHEKLCHANHIDQCSWDYEDWSSPQKSTRYGYVDKALRLLKITDEETLIKILDEL